jgi:hypothetical protein
MQRVAEEDENDTVTSPTTPSFVQAGGNMFRGPFGGDSGSEPQQHSGLRSPPVSEGYPAQYNFGRRTSVSAESLKPVGDSYDNWTPPVHPKTPGQLGRLKKAISGNFLFSHLDDEQSAQVLGALVEKPIPTKGIKVSEPFHISFPKCQHLTHGRLLHKATPAITSTWLRRVLSTSMSIAGARCNQGPTGWDKRSAQSRRADRLASSP